MEDYDPSKVKIYIGGVEAGDFDKIEERFYEKIEEAHNGNCPTKTLIDYARAWAGDILYNDPHWIDDDVINHYTVEYYRYLKGLHDPVKNSKEWDEFEEEFKQNNHLSDDWKTHTGGECYDIGVPLGTYHNLTFIFGRRDISTLQVETVVRGIKIKSISSHNNTKGEDKYDERDSTNRTQLNYVSNRIT